MHGVKINIVVTLTLSLIHIYYKLNIDFMKCILGMVALLLLAASCSNKKENTETSEELLEIIHRVNQRYQSMHKPQVRSFWDNAVSVSYTHLVGRCCRNFSARFE